MGCQISAGHPLRDLFQALVERTFQLHLRSNEPEVTGYVTNLLVDFTHRDQLYRIRDASGRPLDEVAEMLVEGDVQLAATSFERERAVHKHIGDYTLFWTGIYPESLRFARAATRKDHLVDYVAQGRRSYGLASTFTFAPHEQEAPVLRRLSEEFERWVFGLNLVRREMEAVGNPQSRAIQRLMQC